VTLEVEVRGLEDFEAYFAKAPEATVEAARRAINAGARRLASKASEQIRKDVAFRPCELYSPRNTGKITVAPASSESLEARVRGAGSPTLLAKFATNAPSGAARRGLKPRVKVDPGKTVTLNRGFFVRFKNGVVGIAVRLKPGERLVNKKGAGYPLRRGDSGAYILYSVEVDQALAVAGQDRLDEVADFVRAEFFRQLDLAGVR
jgi:hypothetical protein